MVRNRYNQLRKENVEETRTFASVLSGNSFKHDTCWKSFGKKIRVEKSSLGDLFKTVPLSRWNKSI
jgi:hypothetical protein